MNSVKKYFVLTFLLIECSLQNIQAAARITVDIDNTDNEEISSLSDYIALYEAAEDTIIPPGGPSVLRSTPTTQAIPIVQAKPIEHDISIVRAIPIVQAIPINPKPSEEINKTLSESPRKELAVSVKEKVESKNREEKKGHSSLLAVNLLYKKGLKLSEITDLVNNGFDINFPNESGQTLLHEAVKKNDLKLCQSLIALKADVDVADATLQTPLMIAVKEGFCKLCKLLIENGADVNKNDNTGATPLILLAKKRRDTDILNALIKARSNVNIADSDNKTAIDYLKENYHESNRKFAQLLFKAKELMFAGIDLSKINCSDTALILAAKNCNEDVIKFLLENDIYSTTHGERWDSQSNSIDQGGLWGLNALIVAVENNLIDSVRLLLNHGADENIYDNSCKSALYYAQTSDNPQMNRLFLSSRLVRILAKNQGTIAEDINYKKQIINLIKQGADVNFTNKFGYTPLMLATDKDIIRLLLGVGAKLDIKDIYGCTALHEALFHGGKDKVRQLLRATKDVNAVKDGIINGRYGTSSERENPIKLINEEIARRDEFNSRRESINKIVNSALPSRAAAILLSYLPSAEIDLIEWQNDSIEWQNSREKTFFSKLKEFIGH